MRDADDRFLADPSQRLNAAFRAVAPRMQGLPFVNPALGVEAVGFTPWRGCWLGVLVTPWFMNLVLLPRERAHWQTLSVGAKRKLRFPAGVYEFIGADVPDIGEHQTCSLFSPMQAFDDHAAACQVARLALDALFDPANAEVTETAPAEMPSPDHSALPGGNPGTAIVSKRDFLRGRFVGSSDEHRR